MKGALSLQRHHAGSILREEKEPTYSLGNNSGAECEDDSLVDPLQAPKATFQKCAHEESRIPTDWLPSSSEDIEITEVNQYDTSVVSPLLAASQNRGAFKLYSLTESSLGWGLGWAIAAGEEICRTHSMISTEKNYSEPGISSQRIAILAGIIQELPNREQAMALLDIFEKRVLPFTYSVVHVPTLRKELEIFYALDCPQRRASVIEHVDTCWLGIILMTFTLAVQFRPKSDKIPKDLLGPFTNPQYCTLWHSATKTVLVLSGFIGSPRLSVIQTILLLSLYCVRTTEANHGLIRIALTNAQSIGLHRLGDKARQPPTNATPEYMIRRELAKRIWWALILYEWRDITTTIPSVALLDYFNTPMPGNYNDVDLLSVPFPAPHPRDVVTDMSYMLSFIDLTLVYREQAEIIYRLEVKTGKNSVTLPPETIDLLDTKYRAVLENAPILSHSPVRPDLEEIVEVERWAFQVGAFNKMFQLHRNSLSNQNSRRLCVQMARKTLSLQKSIREKSDLPDLLIMSVLQTFMSTVVLCLNLLYLPPPAYERSVMRSEILDGLQAMYDASRKSNIDPRGIRIVEVLLEEEQAQWDLISQPGNGQHLQGYKYRMLNLAKRVAKASHPSSGASSTASGSSSEKGLSPLSQDGSSPSSAPLLSDFPPLQPAYTQFDPYQVTKTGVEAPFRRASRRGAPFDLSTFLDGRENSSQTSPGSSLPNLALDPNMMSTIPTTLPVNATNSDTRNSNAPVNGMEVRQGDASYVRPTGLQNSAGPDMDGFWEWILSQGMEQNTDTSFASTMFPAPTETNMVVDDIFSTDKLAEFVKNSLP